MQSVSAVCIGKYHNCCAITTVWVTQHKKLCNYVFLMCLDRTLCIHYCVNMSLAYKFVQKMLRVCFVLFFSTGTLDKLCFEISLRIHCIFKTNFTSHFETLRRTTAAACLKCVYMYKLKNTVSCLVHVQAGPLSCSL